MADDPGVPTEATRGTPTLLLNTRALCVVCFLSPPSPGGRSQLRGHRAPGPTIASTWSGINFDSDFIDFYFQGIINKSLYRCIDFDSPRYCIAASCVSWSELLCFVHQTSTSHLFHNHLGMLVGAIGTLVTLAAAEEASAANENISDMTHVDAVSNDSMLIPAVASAVALVSAAFFFTKAKSAAEPAAKPASKRDEKQASGKTDKYDTTSQTKKKPSRPNAAERAASKEAAAKAVAEELAAEQAAKAKAKADLAAAQEAAYQAELAAAAIEAKEKLAQAAKEKETAKAEAKAAAVREATAKAEAAKAEAEAMAAAKTASKVSSDSDGKAAPPDSKGKSTKAGSKGTAKGAGKDPAVEAAKAAAKAVDDLNKAAKNDDVKKAEAILDKGLVLVDHVDPETGHTTLHRAAAFNALKVIRLLHSRGAPLDVKNKREQTPLMVAEHIGEPKAAALLRALAAGKSGDDIDDSDVSDTE